MQIEFFLPPNGTHFILFFSVLVLFFEETIYISAQIGGEEEKL